MMMMRLGQTKRQRGLLTLACLACAALCDDAFAFVPLASRPLGPPPHGTVPPDARWSQEQCSTQNGSRRFCYQHHRSRSAIRAGLFDDLFGGQFSAPTIPKAPRERYDLLGLALFVVPCAVCRSLRYWCVGVGNGDRFALFITNIMIHDGRHSHCYSIHNTHIRTIITATNKL